MKRDTQLVGAAGEHLVLSRLLNRQYLAAQAPPGAAKVDILVNHLDGKPPRLIQVKTITGKDINNGWHMSEKHEKIVGPNTLDSFFENYICPFFLELLYAWNAIKFCFVTQRN